MKTAMITGITGQDGSYLAELLLAKGYRVIGLKRRTSLICTERIDGFYDHENFQMRYFDLNDAGCIWRLLSEYKPDEFYNLAAQSHVRVSFDVPINTVYKPLQHKIKNIYIENFERPTTVGPEVSSYDRYPTNDTRINLVTEISFKDLAEPRKVDNVEPHVLSIYDIAGGVECEVPVKPEQWMENFAQFDDVETDYRETKVPFYYLDEEDEPFGRLLSDDKVLTVGKKEEDEFIDKLLSCPTNLEHWDLDTWMYYYPEGTAFKYWHEPELDGFSESCRNNPYAITAKHIFPKEGEQQRVPYLENFEKSPNSRGKWSGKKVEFSFTQTPDRGYLFTTVGFEANDSWYRISFEFENILDWRQRTLEELRGDA